MRPWKWAPWALALSVLAAPALAQPRLPLLGAGGTPSSGFTGPGDIKATGTTPWYGLRGYTAAYAAPGTGKSVNIRRASDNATQDIVILANGDIDLAGYNTFVGTDATASCTLAGTAVACSGAVGTIHVGDPVSGVGIGLSCIVTVTNGSTTATAVLIGTSTTCGTVAVAETVTFQVAGFAAEAYDQSGNTVHALQATAGRQPQFIPNVASSTRPALWCTAGNSTLLVSSATVALGALPVGLSAVFQNITFPGGQLGTMGAGSNLFSFFQSAANTIKPFDGGNSSTLTANDNARNVLAVDWVGASTSTAMVNGSFSSGLTIGTSIGTPAFAICSIASGGGNYGTGAFFEGGWYNAGIVQAEMTSLFTNQSAYW